MSNQKKKHLHFQSCLSRNSLFYIIRSFRLQRKGYLLLKFLKRYYNLVIQNNWDLGMTQNTNTYIFFQMDFIILYISGVCVVGPSIIFIRYPWPIKPPFHLNPQFSTFLKITCGLNITYLDVRQINPPFILTRIWNHENFFNPRVNTPRIR